MIYFWSDTHFNHANIIKFSSRPYSDVHVMNGDLIARWNNSVGDSDTIYLLGDFGFTKAGLPKLSEHFRHLRGHKHLVVGNHDEQNPEVLKLSWESIKDLVTIKENGVEVIACHYPIESWKHAAKGSLMLHGHCHGSLKRVVAHRFDVGVDCFQSPVSLATLAAIARDQVFSPVDHHAN